MSKHYRWFALIVLIVAASLWLISDAQKPEFLLRGRDPEQMANCREQERITQLPQNCQRFEGSFEFSEGLDIVGGLRVLLEAELPPGSFEVNDLRETANNVSRRVNALGLAEATVQVQGDRRILVELPGVTDPNQAISTIQQTALLEFVDFSGLTNSDINNLTGQRILTTEQANIIQARQASGNQETSADAPTIVNPYNGLPFRTVMTGSGLQAANAVLEPQSNRWFIEFSLTPEGSALFGPYTASNIGEAMAIVLDGEVLSAPVINAQLDSGGVIEGNFTQEEAQRLALQLRSGALRIPLRVESAVTVGATLGQESVGLSIRAGIIGVIVVFAFMLIYYRVPGIAADLALAVFIVLNIALFKIVPVTLTLPAITGFLISIGTAVDGNILIFERMKEELRAGKTMIEALDAGFDRAWASIRDSNISTILICVVLFFFGQTPGASIVSGFAVTLALGLIINLFTAVTVTRTFLYIFASLGQAPLARRQWLLGV